MASSSKPTGLHYSLVILVLLTITCGVFWILTNKWYNEAVTERDRAKEEQKRADDRLRLVNGQIVELKRLLGTNFDDLGDENNKNSVIGHLRARLAEFGGDLASTNHEDLLARLRQQLQNAAQSRDALQVALVTEQATFKAKIDELNAAVATQKQARDEADKGKTDADRLHEEELGRLRKDVDDLKKAYAQAQQAYDDLQTTYESTKKQLDQRVQNLLAINRKLTDELDRVNRVSFEVPDGQVVWVDAVSRKVWLDLGEVHGLRPRTTFSVYRKEHSGVGRAAVGGAKGPEDIKAAIEITRVLGPYQSEARIIDEDLYNPIGRGDPVYTPLWSPGRGEAFSFIGVVDLDGDGKSDRDLLYEIVGTAGALIDNDVNERGELLINGKPADEPKPKITERTKFLVKGKIPELADATDPEEIKIIQQIQEFQRELETQARERGVRIVSLGDFLAFVGYKSQRTSSGVTSGAYSGERTGRPKTFEGGATSRSAGGSGR